MGERGRSVPLEPATEPPYARLIVVINDLRDMEVATAYASNGYQRPGSLFAKNGRGDFVTVGAFVEQVQRDLNTNKDGIMQAKSTFVCETLGEQIPDGTPFIFDYAVFGYGMKKILSSTYISTASEKMNLEDLGGVLETPCTTMLVGYRWETLVGGCGCIYS